MRLTKYRRKLIMWKEVRDIWILVVVIADQGLSSSLVQYNSFTELIFLRFLFWF